MAPRVAAPLRPDDQAGRSPDRGAHLAGTNTRRVKRALAALFGGAVGKDAVSRTWRKVRTDWDAWTRRGLAGEDVVRLVLDGTVVRVRIARGLKTPEFPITGGGAGLERALAALWPDVPARRRTVHKHRKLLAHAPDALHEMGYPGRPVCGGFLATAA